LAAASGKGSPFGNRGIDNCFNRLISKGNRCFFAVFAVSAGNYQRRVAPRPQDSSIAGTVPSERTARRHPAPVDTV
jgi:hypothetical protein